MNSNKKNYYKNYIITNAILWSLLLLSKFFLDKLCNKLQNTDKIYIKVLVILLIIIFIIVLAFKKYMEWGTDDGEKRLYRCIYRRCHQYDGWTYDPEKRCGACIIRLQRKSGSDLWWRDKRTGDKEQTWKCYILGEICGNRRWVPGTQSIQS